MIGQSAKSVLDEIKNSLGELDGFYDERARKEQEYPQWVEREILKSQIQCMKDLAGAYFKDEATYSLAVEDAYIVRHVVRVVLTGAPEAQTQAQKFLDLLVDFNHGPVLMQHECVRDAVAGWAASDDAALKDLGEKLLAAGAPDNDRRPAERTGKNHLERDALKVV